MSSFFKLRTADILSGATGTTVRHTSPNRICSFDTVLPDSKLIYYFADIISPLFTKIIANEQQNQTLKQLRDGLLPKLMSGEIDVNNLKL